MAHQRNTASQRGLAPDDVLALFYSAISTVSPHVLAHRFVVLLEFTEEYALGEMKSPLLDN